MTKDYIAGLFDGEGTVYVDPNTHYHIRIAIYNCNKQVVDKLLTGFGGAINVRYERHTHWKTSYMWRLGGDSAVRFLRGLLDVLIIKHEVVRLALILRDSRTGWCKNESVDSVVSRELVYRKFMEYNGKGKHLGRQLVATSPQYISACKPIHV